MVSGGVGLFVSIAVDPVRVPAAHVHRSGDRRVETVEPRSSRSIPKSTTLSGYRANTGSSTWITVQPAAASACASTLSASARAAPHERSSP